jgi:hypothetical protein
VAGLPLLRHALSRIDLFFEVGEVRRVAVQHGAPFAHQCRRGDGLFDLRVRGARVLGGERVRIDAILAGDTRSGAINTLNDLVELLLNRKLARTGGLRCPGVRLPR